jgi:hypothetical protein
MIFYQEGPLSGAAGTCPSYILEIWPEPVLHLRVGHVILYATLAALLPTSVCRCVYTCVPRNPINTKFYIRQWLSLVISNETVALINMLESVSATKVLHRIIEKIVIEKIRRYMYGIRYWIIYPTASSVFRLVVLWFCRSTWNFSTVTDSVQLLRSGARARGSHPKLVSGRATVPLQYS